MSRVLVIGCGGVANVAIRKCCQADDVFTDVRQMTFLRSFALPAVQSPSAMHSQKHSRARQRLS